MEHLRSNNCQLQRVPKEPPQAMQGKNMHAPTRRLFCWRSMQQKIVMLVKECAEPFAVLHMRRIHLQAASRATGFIDGTSRMGHGIVQRVAKPL